MTKPPLPTENSKTKGQHTNATKNFDYTTIADRLRSVGVTSHPTGVVKPCLKGTSLTTHRKSFVINKVKSQSQNAASVTFTLKQC